MAGTGKRVKAKGLKAMLRREKPNITIKNDRLLGIVKPKFEVSFLPFSQRADLLSRYHESFGQASLRNLMHLLGNRYW